MNFMDEVREASLLIRKQILEENAIRQSVDEIEKENRSKNDEHRSR